MILLPLFFWATRNLPSVALGPGGIDGLALPPGRLLRLMAASIYRIRGVKQKVSPSVSGIFKPPGDTKIRIVCFVTTDSGHDAVKTMEKKNAALALALVFVLKLGRWCAGAGALVLGRWC